MTRNSLSILTLAAVLTLGFGQVASADAGRSSSPVFWMWEFPPAATAVGTSSLLRTRNGLNARFQTTGLPAGHAVTLWIMFFNNPRACRPAGAPCAANPDNINPSTGFDFHYVGGHIVNANKTTIAGHLSVGELSTSGWAELAGTGALTPLPTPLTNPLGAEVILAIHSHGPAATGQLLKEQTSSYLGGCILPFLGDPMSGFALGPGDVPAISGECSTIQQSLHLP
ncbi:hypothetical protein [Lentisalinibacter sediminis]|uniref:hypothetical protein n=1 Tax=Lentisalinibacter sediminis TaxID=2992237 RepID=UPI00386A9D52